MNDFEKLPEVVTPKRLKPTYGKHGLKYTLIKRNNLLCIYGVSGHYTDKILHYEVMLIRIRNDKYGYREAIPSDDEFGRTANDSHFQTLAEAEQYFTSWEARILIRGQRSPGKGIRVSLRRNKVSCICRGRQSININLMG